MRVKEVTTLREPLSNMVCSREAERPSAGPQTKTCVVVERQIFIPALSQPHQFSPVTVGETVFSDVVEFCPSSADLSATLGKRE